MFGRSIKLDFLRSINLGINPLGFSPIFDAPLQSTLELSRGSGSTTFSRAIAETVEDFEGLTKDVLSNEWRSKGARRVENLVTDFDFTNWDKLSGGNGSAPTVTSGQSDPNGGSTAYRLQTSLGGGTASGDQSYISHALSSTPTEQLNEVWLKNNGGGTSVKLALTGPNLVTIDNTWKRYSLSVSSVSTFQIGSRGNHNPVNLDLLIWFPQVEDTVGQSNKNPSETISVGVESAPYHGAGVDGVKYFTYANGNIVDGSNVVTEAQGAAFDATDSFNDASGPFGYHSAPSVPPDILSNQVSGNIQANNTTIFLEWTPESAAQGVIFLWGSYVDASNYTAILHDGANIIFRKRISGVNTDATKALAYVADTVYKIAATASSASGQQIYVDGTAGTGHANTTDMQLGTDFEVGTDGNGANGADGQNRFHQIFNSELTQAQIAQLPA
jgi:hypothetical protein